MKNFHDASTGELVSEALSDIKDVVLGFVKSQLAESRRCLPRDDYRELLELSVYNLSGWSSCKRIPVHDPETHAPRLLDVEGHLQPDGLDKPVQGH